MKNGIPLGQSSKYGQYTQERYAWYDYEDNCDDWYMDSCYFLDDNHFHRLFDDSTPPHVEHIL
jgi:hypothetical protein